MRLRPLSLFFGALAVALVVAGLPGLVAKDKPVAGGSKEKAVITDKDVPGTTVKIVREKAVEVVVVKLKLTEEREFHFCCKEEGKDATKVIIDGKKAACHLLKKGQMVRVTAKGPCEETPTTKLWPVTHYEGVITVAPMPPMGNFTIKGRKLP